MTNIIMAYISFGLYDPPSSYIAMAPKIMAYMIMAHMGMAYTIMAYIVIA